MRRVGAGTLLVAFLTLGVIAGCGSETKTVTDSTETAPSAARPTTGSTPEPAGPKTISDGTWKQSADYSPALYRAPGGKNCHWALLKGANRSKGVVESGGAANTQTLQIVSPYFETHGCGKWNSETWEWGPVKSTIPDGIWKEAVDFEIGLYRAPGGPDCHWAALSTANPTTGLFEKGGGDSPQKLEIIWSYFETNDCGTWRKVG